MFTSAYKKIQRTESQIEQIKDQLESFLSTKPYEAYSVVNPERTEESWRHRLNKPLPDELSSICGETLHNLRSSLDLIVCAVARSHSGSDKQTAFPFGQSQATFEDEFKKKTKKLPQVAKDIIRAAEPFKGGHDMLWALHELNRVDKHIDIVAVGAMNPSKAWFTYLSGDNANDIIAIGSRNGTHMLRGEGGFYAPGINAEPHLEEMPDGSKRFVFEGNGGLPVQGDPEFMVCKPGTTFETDFTPAIKIGFANVGHVSAYAIDIALTHMKASVERIAGEFSAAFK